MRLKSMICALAASLAAVLSSGVPCHANPDGPVGSIAVTPAVSVGGVKTVVEPGEAISRPFSAGVDFRIPLSNSFTLGLGVAHVRMPGSGVNGNFLNGIRTQRFDVYARFFIPLTSRARDELARR